MARKSRITEYAKYVTKEQAAKPAPSVKTQKSVLGRLSQLKAQTKTTNQRTEVTA